LWRVKRNKEKLKFAKCRRHPAAVTSFTPIFSPCPTPIDDDDDDDLSPSNNQLPIGGVVFIAIIVAIILRFTVFKKER